MKLVAGLGNPGRKYQGTRHNIGFEVMACVARANSTSIPRAKFHGELSEGLLRGTKTLLLCPHTYMNLSGQSVQAAVDFYKIPPDQILVVCDDFNLPLGRLRFRARGSGGGQKGLTDVIRRLGTDQVARFRIGIGPPPEDWDVVDFVLSRFGDDEQELVQAVVRQAADAVVDWVSEGIDFCMNQYNGT